MTTCSFPREAASDTASGDNQPAFRQVSQITHPPLAASRIPNLTGDLQTPPASALSLSSQITSEYFHETFSPAIRPQLKQLKPAPENQRPPT